MTGSRPTTLAELAGLSCQPGLKRADDATIAAALALLPGWSRVGDTITRTYGFPDFHRTMAFVNAVAWIAHRADHHPDLSVHFNRCVVTFTTHDAGGVTANDLACAARVEQLGA